MLLLRRLTPTATVSGRISPAPAPAQAPHQPRRWLRSPACAAAPPAGDDPATYATRILAAEEAGDWLAAVEVLTEVKKHE